MKNRPYILWGMLIVAAYLLPALIAGENHFVMIHDFLDSTVAHIKSMQDGGILFDNKGIIPILSGIPRAWYLTPFDLKIWFFLLLPAYWAVVANIFLIKFSAFLGLYLLLDNYILPKGDNRKFISFLTAVLFSFVPFYPDYGISSAGVPLVAWAFLNLFNDRRRTVSFLALAYYAIFSWLVLGGVFVCICTALVLLVYMLREKKFPTWPFLGLCLLTLVYVAANYQMFLNFLEPGEAIHREEFKPQGSAWSAIGQVFATLFISQYHAGTCLAVLMVGWFIALWRKRRDENPRWNHLMMAFVALAALILFTGIFKVIFRNFEFIQVFQFDRFFFLYPALCFTLLGMVLFELFATGRKRAIALLSALFVVLGLSFDIFVTNEGCRLLKSGNHPGFKEFYDTELFDKIKADLSANADDPLKVACLGMYQAVAEYNGIYTVDGYIQIYPLEYKHRFQKVIQGELDKDPDLWDYFCNWGTRCYLFSSELGKYYMYSAKDDKSVKSLSIDTQALAELGCQYILSAVNIENASELGLELTECYEGSYWKIRAYRIIVSM